jgi:hypothetical protein
MESWYGIVLCPSLSILSPPSSSSFFFKKLTVHGLMIQWLLMREMFGVTYKK